MLPFPFTCSASLLESLQTVTRTIYNFLPHLDHAAWLTQEGIFTPDATNLLGALCSLFDAPPWWVHGMALTVASRWKAEWSAWWTARWSWRR